MKIVGKVDSIEWWPKYRGHPIGMKKGVRSDIQHRMSRNKKKGLMREIEIEQWLKMITTNDAKNLPPKITIFLLMMGGIYFLQCSCSMIM